MRPLVPLMIAAAAPAGALDCRIEAHPSGFGTELRAVAYSAADAHAQWRFEVDRVSLAGRSSNSQGGQGLLRAGEEMVVGRVALGGTGRTDARLTVTVAGEQASCRLP